jgi:D-amino-acid dehydrogenase
MKKVSIIGGGIIGLSTAYYLSKAGGFEVTIFDSTDLSDGCSYGNAGMIVPSHIIPLAQPGMIAQGMKWMLDSKSPFYVQPRLNLDLMKWGWQFYKNANQKHVDACMPALKDLSLFSKSLYQELHQAGGDFFYEEKGLLMLYQTDKVGEDMIHEGEVAKKIGLEVDFLSKEEVRKLETGTPTNVIGAVHYKSDAHLYPQKLMAYLKSELQKSNVVIKANTKVNDFILENKKIRTVVTDKGEFSTDEVVLCTGSWSPSVAKKLDLSISLLPGKGYSFTFNDKIEKPIIPSILCEGKVAVTPMDNTIRFGGTMEITHTGDTKINPNRIQGIVNTINSFYPTMQIEAPKTENIWYGFRPCTPSGMPIIARDKKWQNLVIAAGHGMMGLSLAPATGKLVSEIMADQKLSVSTKMFQV